MRPFFLLILAACMASQTGCSSIIARSGTDITSLTSRAEVVEVFGPPSSNVQKESNTVEEFKTRRKISEPALSMSYGMELCMFGILETENTAAELIGMTRNTICGQTIQFTFDDSGDVVSYQNDGAQWKYHHLYPFRSWLLKR